MSSEDKTLRSYRERALEAPQKLRSRIQEKTSLRAVTREKRGLEPTIQPNSILYESFAGRGMLCNPNALFQELRSLPQFGHLQHIWVLDDLSKHADLIDEYKPQQRVRFVERSSSEYQKELSTCQYLINNATFDAPFVKQDGQIYVNTWHGTPMKHMGYDLPRGVNQSSTAISNLLQCDYFVSSSPYMTTHMLEKGYRVRDLLPGSVLELGTPRVDAQLKPETAARTKIRLEKAGIRLPAGAKIVTYAPTWRGRFRSPLNDTHLLTAHAKKLQELLGSQYFVLLKVHQSAYENATSDGNAPTNLIPNDIPANDLLSLTDALVTDYSSIAFDYLASDRIPFFFTPDLDDYSATRGLYIRPKDWPGPVSRSISELAHHIATMHDNEKQGLREAKKLYAPYDDGQATRRLIDALFHHDRKHVFQPPKQKEKLLLSLGGLDNHTLADAATTLLSRLNLNRFDVTALLPADAGALGSGLSAVVRIVRPSAMDPRSELAPDLLSRFQAGHHVEAWEREYLNWVARRHWLATFGTTKFDYVVDYDGGDPISALACAQADSPSRSIWLRHPVQPKLAQRLREQSESPLSSMLTLYSSFDNLISVTGELSEVNEEFLRAYAPTARFSKANDLFDHELVSAMATVAEHGTSPVRENFTQSSGGIDPKNLVGLATSLLDFHDWTDAQRFISQLQLVREYFPDHGSGHTYVALGPLVHEKNHRRLLRAFGRVVKQTPDARLLIIGSGPLKNWLKRLAYNYGLDGSVHFLGKQENPYALLAASDTLVIAGDHEGLPTEALPGRLLQVPTVSTEFPSHKSLLAEGAITVRAKVGALADGMLAAQTLTRPKKWQHPEKHNENALLDFYSAIGAVPTRVSAKS